MNLPTQALFALCILPLCAPGVASAQEDKWGKPVDLKLLIPRSFRCRAIASSIPARSAGRRRHMAPLRWKIRAYPRRKQPPTQAAPGIKLSIPTR